MSSAKDSQPFDLEMLGLRRNNPAPKRKQQPQSVQIEETPDESPEAGEQLPKTRARPRKSVSPRYMCSTNKGADVPATCTKLSQSPVADTAANEDEGLTEAIQKATAFRLRNMLKLHKSHKWVIYEWFYSYIDKPFFEDENEFQDCLNQMFPGLKGRQLTRAEWNQIRALMGRPRRCSKAFFDAERRNLECHRQKIRLVQLQESVNVNDIIVKGKPIKIPLILPVGTKVTTWLHLPYIGFFNGTVVSFDALSSMYRVAFDNPNLGTKSVPDFEIVPRNSTMEYVNTTSRKQSNEVDSSVEKSSDNKTYPMKFFEALACAKLTLSTLRANVERITEMNNDAELRSLPLQSLEAATQNYNSPASDDLENTTSLAPELDEEFQRRYAAVTLTIDRKNKDLQKHLNEVRTFAKDLKIFPEAGAMLPPIDLYEMCRYESEHVVQRMNKGTVSKGVPLIQKLAKLLIVASHLGKMSKSAKERVLNVLQCSIEEVRSGLCGSNVERFFPRIESLLNIIIANLTAEEI